MYVYPIAVIYMCIMYTYAYHVYMYTCMYITCYAVYIYILSSSTKFKKTRDQKTPYVSLGKELQDIL